MQTPKIALQLYTIRDKLLTAADYGRCMRDVRGIGYEGVEGRALDPLIDAAELRRVLDGEGLSCCALHASREDLEQRFDKTVEALDLLGCRAVGFPWLEERYWNEAGVAEIAAFLDERGARLRARGIRLIYHNHHVEFQRIGNATILERLFALTDPVNLWAELDTYWVQYGGADPCAWIRRMAGRTSHLHCKDLAVVGTEVVFAEVGQGNLDWPAIIPQARNAGVEWYIVEQDHARRDSMESAAISHRYLREALAPNGGRKAP